MKYILLLILFLTLSCRDSFFDGTSNIDEHSRFTLIVLNESGHKLRIIAHDKGEKYEDIIIENGKKYKKHFNFMLIREALILKYL